MRYVDARGETVGRIFHRRSSADHYAEQVADRGGSPTVHATDVAWAPIPAGANRC